jgi:lysophospholipase L1-like esterase
MRSNVRLVKTLAISLFVVAASVVTVGAASATPPTKGLQYVALGDSYSSGLGLGDDVAGSPDFCHRSRQNFPHRVAQTLDLQLTDVTCAGATTANVSSTPLKDGADSAPVQVGSLSAKTDVVTISIGGNDLGFVDAARSCVALGATGPLLLSKAANCRSLYVKGGTDELLQRLDGSVVSGLQKTFADIHRAAPNATVFVVGYPTLFPDSAHTPAGGCFDAKLAGDSLQSVHAVNILPFTDTDVAYLHSIEQALDDSTRAAAAKAGFTYISTLGASAAHSACAASDERYVNGVSFDRSKSGGVLLSDGSLHPDSAGAAFLAAAVEQPITKAFTPAVGHSAPTASPPRIPILLGALVVLVVAIAVAVVIVVVVRARRRRRSAH